MDNDGLSADKIKKLLKEELFISDETSLQPGMKADTAEEVQRFVAHEVRKLYDVYSYNHAASILKNSFPLLLQEIENVLLNFQIDIEDISIPGGNESNIPPRFSRSLRPLEWYEAKIKGTLVVVLERHKETLIENTGRMKKERLPDSDPAIIHGYMEGHKIDYVKEKVALDLEWNSKDQTFDRDLYAFRLFYEAGIIEAGVLVTRSEKLTPAFAQIPKKDKDGNIQRNNKGEAVSVKAKYGASTTWMGKLLYRLNAGRHGGCPILVFGIRPDIIQGWPVKLEDYDSK